jgi:Gly-Xaa carboxypeptidase
MPEDLPEKTELLPTTVTHLGGRATPWSRLLTLLSFASLAALWGTFHIYTGPFTGTLGGKGTHASDALCPQVDQLMPVKHADLYEQLGSLIGTESYKQRAIDWLAGAVRIPTESYDEMGEIGEDPRWDAFAPFHTYLQEAFPLMSSSSVFTHHHLSHTNYA